MRKSAGIAAILPVAAFFLLSAAAPPQTKKKTTGSQKKTTSTKARGSAEAAIAYDTKPIDLSAKSLPPGYRGNSFRKIYESAVLVPAKGEFETTAEHQQRTQRTLDGVYAIVLDDAQSTYNADAEVMEVHAQTTRFKLGAAIRDVEQGYTVESKKIAEREYVASNAFGANAVVTSSTYDVSGIIPKAGPLAGVVTFPIKLQRADAQRIKPNLKLLAIGKMSPQQEPTKGTDSGSNGFQVIEATLDSPSEINYRLFLLRMELVDLWVFDSSTGVILAKHSDRDDHDRMQIAVRESEDHDGYAVVSVLGNEALKLQRGFAKFGGGCYITVGGLFEVVGVEGRVWGVGGSMVDLGGRKRLVLLTGDGDTLFDEQTPNTFGRTSSSSITPWPKAEEAARLMWKATPDGFLEVKGGDPRFVSKAPLAGFHELWTWGVANCDLPTLKN